MKMHKQMTPVSLETYFELEDDAETKSEYFNGVIVPMPPFSAEHCTIAFNLSGETGTQIRRSECQGYGSQLRILSEVCNTVLYPDLTIACETPELAKTRYATLLNPTLVVEIMAASTEAKDRRRKFPYYSAIPTLRVHILVSQDRPLVEIYTRQADGSWQQEAFSGIKAVTQLPAIGAMLRLSEVYHHITFPD